MTDERPTEGTLPPDPDFPTPPPAPAPSWTGPAAPPPPPLAPMVNQAATAPAPPTGEQPAVAWAAPAAPVAAAGKGPRTVWSMVAGILLVIGGILGGLAGLAVAVLGGAVIGSLGDLGTIPGMEGIDAGAFASGVIVFVGLIILVYSLMYLIGGIGVLRSRDWGRILGLIVGILSGLIWLGSVTTPDQSGVRDSIVGSLIAFGIHAYIVAALLFFWRSKPSTA